MKPQNSQNIVNIWYFIPSETLCNQNTANIVKINTSQPIKMTIGSYFYKNSYVPGHNFWDILSISWKKFWTSNLQGPPLVGWSCSGFLVTEKQWMGIQQIFHGNQGQKDSGHNFWDILPILYGFAKFSYQWKPVADSK